MSHVMVDLETLDNKPTSAIVSIGAVIFNNQGLGGEFYMVVDIDSCIEAGMTVSASTIAWWMKQGNDARQVFNEHSTDLKDVLDEFSKWLPTGYRLWGNGAAFDNAILSNAYNAVGLHQPWDLWNNRCYQTIAAMRPKKRVQHGTYHNALDDARSQARHLILISPGSCA